MRHFKRVKYLLVTSLCLTIAFVGIVLIINADRVSLDNVSLILFLIIALGPNLIHIYVSYTLAKNYFPSKEVPRSFIISFQIVSIFAWIVFIGLILVIFGMILQYYLLEQSRPNWHSLALPALAILILLICLIPFQLVAARRLLSTIQENHKKNLLESFN